MSEAISNQPLLQPVERKHLNEGVKPIMVCIGRPEEFGDDLGLLSKIAPLEAGLPDPTVDSIDFFEDPFLARRKGFKTAGERTYVISTLNGLDKFSGDFIDCTGLLISGTEKGTGRQLSFMSHKPSVDMTASVSQFSKDLVDSLKQAKEQCKEGTLDAVIFGGRYKGAVGGNVHPNTKAYLDSVDLVSRTVEAELGFEPTVVGGPKINPGTDTVFFDNMKRRLYLIRATLKDGVGTPDFNPSFVSSDAELAEKNWKPGEWESTKI